MNFPEFIKTHPLVLIAIGLLFWVLPLFREDNLWP